MDKSLVKDIIIPIVSLIISIWAIIKSYITDAKANKLSEENTKLANANIELDIRNLIRETRKDLDDKLAKFLFLKEKEKKNSLTQDEKINLPICEKQLNNAKQEYLNAYEEACMKYIDGKIDKERFKKTYVIELRNIVGSVSLKKYIDSTSSPYNAIKKVYTEWNNLEENT